MFHSFKTDTGPALIDSGAVTAIVGRTESKTTRTPGRNGQYDGPGETAEIDCSLILFPGGGVVNVHGAPADVAAALGIEVAPDSDAAPKDAPKGKGKK